MFDATSPSARTDHRPALVKHLVDRMATDRGCQLLGYWLTGRRNVVVILGAPHRAPWSRLDLEPFDGYELASFEGV
jgi:hypothetical protein